MDTLQIKIKNKETYQHLMWFLKKFNREELEIIESKSSFEYIQEELQHELHELDSGNSTLMDIEDLDKELEKIILE
jgi:hypothetical protein